MSRGSPPGNSAPFGKVPISPKSEYQFVCPFCGSINEEGEGSCPHCTMEDTPAGRKATKARIGPWYVLQRRNPAAPGMKFETLLTFVQKGRVKPRSVVRGPTTHQLWRFASQVKGLSREFGICYSCGGKVTPTSSTCPQCNRLQAPPPNPDVFLELDAEPPPIVYREIPVTSEANESILLDPLPIEAIFKPEPATPPPAPVEPLTPAAPPERSPMPATPAAADPAEEANEIIVPTLQEPSVATEQDLVVPSLNQETAPVAPAPEPLQEEKETSPAATAPSVPAGPPTGRIPPESFDDDDEPSDDDDPRHGRPTVGPAFRAPPRPEAFREQRKRYWVEGSLFVLVLIIAVISGLFSVEPKMQARTTAWINKALHAVGVPMSPAADKVGAEPEPQVPPPAPAAPSNPSPSQFTPPPWALPASAPASPAPTSSQARTSSSGVAPPGNVSKPTPTATGTAAPTASVPPPAAAPTSPPATPAPAPSESPAAEAPAAASPTPAPTDDDPFERARILRRQAIDAENSGDYAHAVALFQSIKDLPREVWPGDLELRLRAAKANLDAQNQQH